MRKTIIGWAVFLILIAPGFSGVIKRSKSEITFRGFGKFTLVQSDKLTSQQKWSTMVTDFKGQGLAGGLAGKTILRSGDTGEIVDLPGATLYQLDNKKKEYTVSPIEKLKAEKAKEPAAEETEEKEQAERNIKVTKNEFKVEDTKEESIINNFPVRKYFIHWLLEWEDLETGEKGTSRLESLVWTTPLTETIEKAHQEEMAFSRAYMEKVGLEPGKKEEDVLGVRWMDILDSFGRSKGRPRRDYSKAEAELQKIKGYPIVVDGKYFVSSEKPAGMAEEEEQPAATDVRGRLGGLLKKTLKKKPAEATSATEPSLAFRTEVVEISNADLSASDFQVPAGYKKKG